MGEKRAGMRDVGTGLPLIPHTPSPTPSPFTPVMQAISIQIL